MPLWLTIGCIALVLLGFVAIPFAFGAMMAYGAPESVMGPSPGLTKATLIALIVFPAIAWAGAFGAWRFYSVGMQTAWIAGMLLAPLIYLAVALQAYSTLTAAPPAPANAPADNTALAAYLAQNPNLGEVNLIGLGLTEVPPALFTAVTLKRINLSQNKITRIPDELGRLPQLEMLMLSSNPISNEEVARWLAARTNNAAVTTSAPSQP